MTWSDLDGDLLCVNKSIAQKLKGDDRKSPPKTQSSVRTLRLSAQLLDVLAKHKERQQAEEGYSEENNICGGVKVLRDTTIDKHNRRYAELAELHHICIHDFRHSHATLLANEGINIQEIARRLGHSKIEETWNTYSHLYPREEEKAVAILNKLTLTDE